MLELEKISNKKFNPLNTPQNSALLDNLIKLTLVNTTQHKKDIMLVP